MALFHQPQPGLSRPPLAPAGDGSGRQRQASEEVPQGPHLTSILKVLAGSPSLFTRFASEKGFQPK